MTHLIIAILLSVEIALALFPGAVPAQLKKAISYRNISIINICIAAIVMYVVFAK